MILALTYLQYSNISSIFRTRNCGAASKLMARLNDRAAGSPLTALDLVKNLNVPLVTGDDLVERVHGKGETIS